MQNVLAQGVGSGRSRRAAAVLPVLALLLGAAGAAATESATQPERLTEFEHVHMVLLPATVTTKAGKPVRGLGPADFDLLDRGIAQEIAVVDAASTAPVSIAFLLDVSGSMALGNKLEQAKWAIEQFVGRLRSTDRFGLIAFADRQVTWITPFTSDRANFLQRLRVQEGLGPTALLDALATSPQLVEDADAGRAAIVLLTDGFDNASRLSQLEAVWLARSVNVPIYVLSFVPMARDLFPPRVRDALRTLERFATETGGTLFTLHEPTDLLPAVAAIESEMRHQYVVGFYPKPIARDGAFHPVDLVARGGALRVRTRRGYYARP